MSATSALAAHRDDQTRLSPFGGTDLWRLFAGWADRDPQREHLIWQPFEAEARTYTFGQLAQEALGVASALHRRGVRPGDRVLIHLGNCPEFVLSYYACAALGAVAVTTNTALAKNELSHMTVDAAVVGAITSPSMSSLVDSCLPPGAWLMVTDHDAGVRGDEAYGDDAFTTQAPHGWQLPARPIDASLPMSVQFTSGTTSRPKGVIWTHANALWAGQVSSLHEGLRETDCHYTYLPLFHTNALSYSMLASLWVGARWVLVPKWSTSRFWEVSRRHECTWLPLIGLSYFALLNGDAPKSHSYRMFGRGICDSPLDAMYGVKTLGWWGMTETVSHPIIGQPHLPDHPMSMGRPAVEYGVKVVSDDGRTPANLEEPGHLRIRGIRGVSIFDSYLNQPEATAASFDEDGWFITGDVVTLHETGYLSFVERATDVLKVDGENVAASEVEQTILKSGLVEDAAVVAKPHPIRGEVPVAFVVLRSDVDPETVAEELTRICRTSLAHFKVPLAFHQVDSLPRATLNKVNKGELRRQAKALASEET